MDWLILRQLKKENYGIASNWINNNCFLSANLMVILVILQEKHRLSSIERKIRELGKLPNGDLESKSSDGDTEVSNLDKCQ